MASVLTQHRRQCTSTKSRRRQVAERRAGELARIAPVLLASVLVLGCSGTGSDGGGAVVTEPVATNQSSTDATAVDIAASGATRDELANADVARAADAAAEQIVIVVSSLGDEPPFDVGVFTGELPGDDDLASATTPTVLTAGPDDAFGVGDELIGIEP